MNNMKPIKLLFVEDDDALAFMVTGSLDLSGKYEIHRAANGAEGLTLYNNIHPDIIVADVEMPEMSGFEMVRKIRETDTFTPIIFASARKSPKDFIEGLHVGADNFIRKPYLPEELEVQMTALLRRINKEVTEEAISSYKHSFGNYRLDTQARTLEIKGGNSFLLTERETGILKILSDRKGEIVKRDEILTVFWGNSDFYTTRSLDVFIANIRKYLKEDGSVEIQTIRGEGFRLVTDK